MSDLLDTSVLISFDQLPSSRQGRVFVSVISVGELEAGVLVATSGSERTDRLRRLSTILASNAVLSADGAVATRFGELRAASGRLPSNDLWIAATALAHDLTLVTADERLAKLPLVRTEFVS